MIIEVLTKLDDLKRKATAFLTVLVVVCICYFAITRDSVAKLKAANASYAGVQTAYANTDNQKAELVDLQKQLIEKEKHLHEYQEMYFSSKRAEFFFENINTMALAYNLRPISRAISEAKNLIDDKVEDENTPPKEQFLKTQSANIVVSGGYFDIVDFMNQLIGCPQKVYITNLRINLPAGEKFKPKASFKISLLIDLNKDLGK